MSPRTGQPMSSVVEVKASRTWGRIIALDTPQRLIDSVGGGAVLLGIPQSVPDPVIERARALPGVRSVECREGQLSITALDLQAALVSVIGLVSKAGVVVRSLEILEPNLEAVFLNLTGRKLRD